MPDAQPGPSLVETLRQNLEGQDSVVRETVVAVVDFPPGTVAPWHTHPGAQELLHVIEGNVDIVIKDGETKHLKAGQAGIIPAEIVHLARNASSTAPAKAVAVFSRAKK